MAMDSEAKLFDAGFARVLIESSEEAALDVARDEALDFALIAVTTVEAGTGRVAQQLKDKGVPFAFSCDFFDGCDRPEGWEAIPYLVRPFSAQDLAGAMARAGLSLS